MRKEGRNDDNEAEAGERKLTVDDISPAFPLIYEIVKKVDGMHIQTCNKIWVEVKRENLLDFCKFLKEHGFDHLSCVLGVDMKEYLEVVYHVWSYIDRRMISIKVKLPYDDPVVDSVTSIWKSADWHERETYDMFGIVFRNHPNLKRILLPDDFEGHPLRKDFKVEERGWY
jgi:NADH-quinone oxidoreductase subunit C